MFIIIGVHYMNFCSIHFTATLIDLASTVSNLIYLPVIVLLISLQTSFGDLFVEEIQIVCVNEVR